MMEIVLVDSIPKLNATPLAEVCVRSSAVCVELDDVYENRIELRFLPYQAMRMVTADCFLAPEGQKVPCASVVELVGSPWIQELKAKLAITDEDADFLDKSRHFLVPLQDDFLEVVAWSIEVAFSK